jgi:acyl-CoA oxidase
MAGMIETDRDQFLSLLPDIHAISAAFKALVTWQGSTILEECRRACGGHAYSAYNAIAGHIGDWGVMTTGGGDNIVLAQQAARYLLTAASIAAAGGTVEGSASYLNDAKRLLGIKKYPYQGNEASSTKALLEALTWLSIQKTQALGQDFASAKDQEAFWNDHQSELVNLSLLYAKRHIVYLYDSYIHSPQVTSQYANLVPVLERLGRLYALYIILDELVYFMEFDYMTSEQSRAIRNAFYQACADLRPDAVPLVDAWAIPDFVLKAPIGRYDGDIYSAYLETLRLSPNCSNVPHYHDASIRPLTGQK